jgi:hypothetical protein
MELLLELTVMLAIINSILLVILVSVYGRTTIRTRAIYPAGFLVFSVLMLIQRALNALGYSLNPSSIGDEAYPSTSIVGILELGGLPTHPRITV